MFLRPARRVQSLCSSRIRGDVRYCKQLHDSSNTTARHHDPLKILFCGADDFSTYSLRALCELKATKRDVVESIDVVCRPGKRVGRGLKQVQEVPIKPVASELGLQLHQIDTFRNWSPPPSINLVVAVSFGLLVPSRILNGAKYGGLNVHPSLLPDLRGPAPMIHTLLKRREHTGVTLQTMHPTQFDHGDILAQTPLPGVPVPSKCTPDDLLRILGPLGAEILCRGIEAGIFVPPIKDVRGSTSESAHLDHAPKVTPEDRHIDWNSWTAGEIQLRDRVLGRLWDMETYSRCFPDRTLKRTTFHGPWTVLSHANDIDAAVGAPVLVHDQQQILGFKTVDGKLVCASGATLDGEKKGTGLLSFRNSITAE